MEGHFDEARQLLRARAADLQGVWARAVRQRRVAARPAWSSSPPGDFEAAAHLLAKAPQSFARWARPVTCRRTSQFLGDALYRLGRYDEAEEAASESKRTTQAGDVASETGWRSVRATRAGAPWRAGRGALARTRGHRLERDDRLAAVDRRRVRVLRRGARSWQVGTRRPSLRWNMRSSSTSARDTARTLNGRERRSPSSSTTSSASTARSARAPFSTPNAPVRPASSPAARARAAACASSRTAPLRASRSRAPRGPRSPARGRARSRRSGTAPRATRRSWKAASMPESASQSWSSRMPGVSSTSPPSGRGTSWRCDVVCRPRPSSRISCVGEQLLADERVHERRLADAGGAEQRRRPSGGTYERTVSTPSPCGALTAWTGTPNATDSTS